MVKDYVRDTIDCINTIIMCEVSDDCLHLEIPFSTLYLPQNRSSLDVLLEILSVDVPKTEFTRSLTSVSLYQHPFYPLLTLCIDIYLIQLHLMCITEASNVFSKSLLV